MSFWEEIFAVTLAIILADVVLWAGESTVNLWIRVRKRRALTKARKLIKKVGAKKRR